MGKAGTTAKTAGYKEIKAEIRDGIYRPLYVIYGEESFLIDKIVESLIQALIAPGCEALDKVMLDAGGQPARLDPERLKAELLTPPFLSGKKLVIVKNSGWLSPATGGSRAQEQNAVRAERESDLEEKDEEDQADYSGSTRSLQKNRQDLLASLLDHLPECVCLVMIEQKVDRRLKQLVSLIEQKGLLAEFGQEDPKTLQQWVDVECRRRGLMIEPVAAESLIDRCDCSMRQIWQEMSKLFLFCEHAASRKIDLALVNELSLPDLRGNIFDLTDALSDGRTGRALQLLDNLIGQKEPVQLIQFMLARHLRQLICAAELGRPDRIASELKVMPFVASRLASQARRLPIPVLEDLYGRSVESDTQVKTGKIGDRLALETFLAESAETFRKTVRRQ